MLPSSVPALDLDPVLVPWIALAGLAVGGLALFVGLLGNARVRWLRRALKGRHARSEPVSTSAVVGRAGLHVAVARYDAFGDTGGRMSFSAALLDDAGDGLVLTALNGRTEGRTYAKSVTGGAPAEHPLSPEEEQAVQEAMSHAAAAGRGS